MWNHFLIAFLFPKQASRFSFLHCNARNNVSLAITLKRYTQALTSDIDFFLELASLS